MNDSERQGQQLVLLAIVLVLIPNAVAFFLHFRASGRMDAVGSLVLYSGLCLGLYNGGKAQRWVLVVLSGVLAVTLLVLALVGDLRLPLLSGLAAFSLGGAAVLLACSKSIPHFLALRKKRNFDHTPTFKVKQPPSE